MYELAGDSPSSLGHRIERELVRVGVDIAPWRRERGWHTVFSNVLTNLDHTEETTLLGDIAAISDSEVDLTQHDRWSLSALGDLVAASGYNKVGIREFRAAMASDAADLRPRWLRALAKAYGIDPALAASQARHVACVSDAERTWSLVTTPPASRLVPREKVRLTQQDQHSVIDCMLARSSWIASSAAAILIHNPFPEAAGQLMTLLPTGLSGRDRLIATVVVLVADRPDEVAQELTVAPESALRAGVADSLVLRRTVDEFGVGMLTRLATDDDLTVRKATQGGVGEPLVRLPNTPATYWSCRWCDNVNQLTQSDCANCELSSQ
jgi:hypothetical protein